MSHNKLLSFILKSAYPLFKCGWSGDPLELPTDDAGMEDGSLSCCRQHNGVETS